MSTTAALAAFLTSSSSAAAPLTGSITKTYSAGECDNQQPAPPHTPVPPSCWYCKSPVNLDSVTITIDQPVVEEGVRLGPGCTGRIGKITVITQGGDGIKVTDGASDLTVGSGSVTCGIPTGLNNVDTDQYGIRVWGGNRVTFAGMYVDCQAKTASGSYASRMELFINQSPKWTAATDAQKPTKVLFVNGCLASGPQKTVNIGTSLQSGVATSVVYPFITPNQGPTFDTPAVPGGQGPPADQPLNFANTFPAAIGSCAGPNG